MNTKGDAKTQPPKEESRNHICFVFILLIIIQKFVQKKKKIIIQKLTFWCRQKISYSNILEITIICKTVIDCN